MSAESEIVAQLSERLQQLEQAEEARNASVPRVAEDESAPGETPLDPIRAKAQLMEFFDVPAWARNSTDMQSQMSAIVEWASEEAKYLSEAPSLADVLKVINDQLRIMGASFESDRLRRLWQFTKIRAQRRLLEEKERGLYNG